MEGTPTLSVYRWKMNRKFLSVPICCPGFGFAQGTKFTGEGWAVTKDKFQLGYFLLYRLGQSLNCWRLSFAPGQRGTFDHIFHTGLAGRSKQ